MIEETKIKKYHLSGRGRCSKILRNKFYLGMVKIDGKWTQGMHTPIITTEMFEKAQSNSPDRALMRED